jgi:glucokinase
MILAGDIGGGIAPEIEQKLSDGTFMKSFTDKVRLFGLLASIPVRVILEPLTALYGTAEYALRREKNPT